MNALMGNAQSSLIVLDREALLVGVCTSPGMFMCVHTPPCGQRSHDNSLQCVRAISSHGTGTLKTVWTGNETHANTLTYTYLNIMREREYHIGPPNLELHANGVQ